MEKVEIRRLNKTNIEEIIPLRISLQKVDFENNLGIDEQILINKTKEFLNENLDKDLFMYGTYVEEELVSICGLTIFKYFPKEEYRHKGYQKQVFKECINLGKELGITRFKLSTKNPVAMKMYESFNFMEDEHAKKMTVMD